MIRRRDFLGVVGGAAAWPVAARAQQPALPVIGFLSNINDRQDERIRAFRQGLNEIGFIEGQNIMIEYRLAGGRNHLLPELVAELVHRQVAVIAAGPTPAAMAARLAPTTIPVVFYTTGDPVELGLVASLNRPAGNMTGVTSLHMEVGPKRIELLHEMVPMMTDVAMLVNPTATLAETLVKDAQVAVKKLGLRLHVLQASSKSEFQETFAAIRRLRAGGLVIGPDALFTSSRATLGAMAAQHGVPAAYSYREFTSAGGLISYGGNLADWYRLVGVYTGRVLRGIKPADLPVQQATKVELIVNLKAAKALGLTVPVTLLGRADEVIE